MKATMIGTLLAASSSAAAAFGVRSAVRSAAFRPSAVRAFSRTTQLFSTTTSASFDPSNTALVVVDPQNDFLSPEGVTWGVVGESVTENGTVENLERLFKAAAEKGYLVFISPHYYFPHDHKWEFEGNLEVLMHKLGMFDRKDALNVDNFDGSGSDWVDVFKPYIKQDNVIVCSPHKVYGPEQNDLSLQIRKRKIDRIILGGMSANLCVESHLRELVEQGFDVSVASDATAGAKLPEGDGYQAALTNFKFIATHVLNTTDMIDAMASKEED